MLENLDNITNTEYLRSARDDTSKAANDSISRRNNIKHMVTSGSKGKLDNIS